MSPIDEQGELCIGVDIGGTFTDVVLTDADRTWRSKAPSTPDDLGRGVLDACTLVAERAGFTLESLMPRVRRFGLGTTAVTNALASRAGRRVGLVTTKGFEDLVPLARGRRVNEDGWLMMPPQVVERRCIVGVDERVDRHGAVLTPLDVGEVVAAARMLVDAERVEALAVSFLWSFRNPIHEEQAVGALADAFPTLPVTSGAALHPVIREFERSTFALLNAYASGALTGVDRLAAELERLGLPVPVLLVHSGGGSTTIAEARRMPISLAESGPAAGVAAAVEVARAAGLTDAVTCDMGGTSFDVSVVIGGQATRRARGDLMGIWTALSLVDVDSIGAGGGSIGWIDARGMLRVGPHSAGAVPGPACYGRGGTEPTVTDALLVLGHLAPDQFLGGDMTLDADAAADACARLGEQLALSGDEVAWGIREIALAGMAKSVRGRLAERGLDPRGRALISYGGCGGLFAADIARAIRIDTVVVPELASVLSAFGAATADVRREHAQSLELSFPLDVDAVMVIAEKLRGQVDADVAADGIAPNDRSVHFEADLRFKRQKWELTVPLAGARLDTENVDDLVRDFRTEYARRYGEGALMAGAVVELVSLRAIGVGRTVKPALAPTSTRSGNAQPRPVSVRPVSVNRGASPLDVEVYAGRDLLPGNRLRGPALVDGVDTTVWVPPGAELRVDDRNNLVVEVAEVPVEQEAREHEHVVDPITLEVLRTRLDAISDEAAATIERTAISPVVTESKDYSATILDADGNLVTGGGRIEYHFGAAMNAVRSTIARHGDTIRPGDVFLANDPHNGGGLHAQDVMVQQPVFVDGERVAWVVNSAHLMDMGGMVMGSWAPAATECYQEAIRFPPVRLFREGVEESDVFSIFRNNVRLSTLVEMDLRALVAGCHVAEDKLIEVVGGMGVTSFRTAVQALCDSGERELRHRIEAIADGTYRVVTWTEWGDELYAVPCTLTVAGDGMVFDFTGASPQAPHFFNSKPYIIASELVADVCTLLAQDLPFSSGLFRPFELRCPEGSIVNSEPPAPVASAHMDAAFCAATVGTQCVVLALAASPDAPGRQYLSGPSGTSGLATHTWSCMVDGAFDGWVMNDGCLPAPSAGHDRDGNDLFSFLVGRQGIVEFIDVEILESWYPLLVREKKPRPGAFGAGTFRSGAGCQMSYRPYGTDALYGVMLAMRERLPLMGMAGGFPGATTSFLIHRADGSVEAVDGHAMNVFLGDGDTFEFLCASGGGWGDPLERDPDAVADDVALGRVTAAEADEIYGVVLDTDGRPFDDQTAARRDAIRAARLAQARPARKPPTERAVRDASALPLYPGVVQLGSVAFSEASGAPLASSPDHWTDGCPVVEARVTNGKLALVIETYLDPITGSALAVDVRPEASERTFTSSPVRWVDT